MGIREIACHAPERSDSPSPILCRRQVQMPLVYIQFVGKPHAVGCCGPQCGGAISLASGRLE
eukprot:1128615-Pelagomonas_calceolata.AAC.1